MNEIFLDTETTGLSAKDGDRIVEIACIETKDLIPTNRVFHKLINPQKNVSSEAFKVHGFSDDFLKILNRIRLTTLIGTHVIRLRIVDEALLLRIEGYFAS